MEAPWFILIKERPLWHGSCKDWKLGDGFFLVPTKPSATITNFSNFSSSNSIAASKTKEYWNYFYWLRYFYAQFQVLNYVATMIEMPEEELAQLSYQNAMRLFSYPGSKLVGDCWDVASLATPFIETMYKFVEEFPTHGHAMYYLLLISNPLLTDCTWCRNIDKAW